MFLVLFSTDIFLKCRCVVVGVLLIPDLLFKKGENKFKISSQVVC
jgi:hypothetical protein